MHSSRYIDIPAHIMYRNLLRQKNVSILPSLNFSVKSKYDQFKSTFEHTKYFDNLVTFYEHNTWVYMVLWMIKKYVKKIQHWPACFSSDTLAPFSKSMIPHVNILAIDEWSVNALPKKPFSFLRTFTGNFYTVCLELIRNQNNY